MTPAQQVALAWEHRDHFAAVAQHNLEVTIRRMKKADWAAPENQYRNPWAELETETQQTEQMEMFA